MYTIKDCRFSLSNLYLKQDISLVCVLMVWTYPGCVERESSEDHEMKKVVPESSEDNEMKKKVVPEPLA